MFDIQLFADTVTSSSAVKVVMEFYDSDNRTIAMDNPKDNLGAADINSVVDWFKANQPIIGDKAGASVVGASRAFIEEKTVTKLDLA